MLSRDTAVLSLLASLLLLKHATLCLSKTRVLSTTVDKAIDNGIKRSRHAVCRVRFTPSGLNTTQWKIHKWPPDIKSHRCSSHLIRSYHVAEYDHYIYVIDHCGAPPPIIKKLASADADRQKIPRLQIVKGLIDNTENQKRKFFLRSCEFISQVWVNHIIRFDKKLI